MVVESVNVAVVGVGNCASAFVQGLEYYRLQPNAHGLMHQVLGRYSTDDIRVVAAFDISAQKVGQSLSKALFAPPNNTMRFSALPQWADDIEVHRGMVHDGIGKYLEDVVEKAQGDTADIQKILKDTNTNVVVLYLPVGSEEAVKWYVEQALAAKCAVVNCIPVFIASSPYWQHRFASAGVPIIGDDIKSQVGATIVHRVLAALMRDRGVQLQQTLQLNVGGNSDFLNMLERERLASKKVSKTQAVTSVFGGSDGDCPAADKVHIGPSDYVSWLTDRKWAYIRLEGAAFGGVPLNIELKLEVWDSPNSAGVVIDAVRCAKIALDRGLSGALVGPSAYLMKSPPKQLDDSVARDMLSAFADGKNVDAEETVPYVHPEEWL